MKKLLLIFFLLFAQTLCLTAQTTIFNVAGGLTLPTGWVGTDNKVTNPIENSDYYLLEADNPGDILETDIYDLSGYLSVTFSLDVATYGNGTANYAIIEISSDGGSTYAQVENSATPTGNGVNLPYISGGSFKINTLSNQVKIRISNNGTSGKGVRLQNLILSGYSSSTPNIVYFDATNSNATETNGTVPLLIPITLQNYAGSQVDFSVTVTSGTAEAGDYVLNTTSLSFTSDGTQDVSITINADADIDPETIVLTLLETTATGATILTGSHTINVADDDIITCTAPSWNIINYVVNSEGDVWSENSGEYLINGKSNKATDPTDAWLIYGPLDMTNTDFLTLKFDLLEIFVGSTLEVFYSESYSGCPVSAGNNWVSVASLLTTHIEGTQNIALKFDAATNASTYIAIQYTGDGGAESSVKLSNFTLEADACPSLGTFVSNSCCIISTLTVDRACNGNAADFTLNWTEENTSGSFQADINGNGYQTLTAGGVYTITGPTTAAANVTVTVRDASSPSCFGTTTTNIPTCPFVAPNVLINEIDCDQTGADADEFIELYGTPNLDLSGLVIVLFNGGDGLSNGAFDLDGYSLDANGFFTLGSSTVTDADMTFSSATGNLQNGADAVALYVGDAADFPNDSPPTTTSLVDVIIYDTGQSDDPTLLTGLGQTTQYNEDENAASETQSIQRSPNGSANIITANATPTVTNLPVALLYFTAKADGQTVVLDWATASEENNAYFDIQHSTNGENFETIERKDGAGTSFVLNTYTSRHQNPSNGENYYRLRQIDFDGSWTYYPVAAVSIEKAKNLVRLMPSQVNQQFDLVINTPLQKNTVAMIYNANGQLVQSEKLAANTQRKTIRVARLPSGFYFLRMMIADEMITERFFKF